MTPQLYIPEEETLRFPMPVRDTPYFLLTFENVMNILNSEHMTRTEQAELLAEQMIAMARLSGERL